MEIMKKGNAMLKSIFNTAILFAVMCIFALASCAPISDSAGAINGGGADSSNRNGVPITITLPSIKNKSASIRALTDEQRTRLERETAKYRVTFSSAGQMSTREGDGTTYSAYFPVGAQVGITVYCLNSNDEVIVETVTKTITVSSGANRLDFKLSEDGTEIILPPPPAPPSPPSVKSAVSYELDGGDWSPTSAPPQTEEYDEGATVTITTNEPTKQGFTFLGWKSSVSSLIPSGGGDNFQAGSTFTMPSSAVTFTAQWTSLPTHTVTYDLGFDPSSGSRTSTAQVPEGAAVSLTAPSAKRVGYEFEYWMYNQAQAPSGLTMGNSDITLVAQWEEILYRIEVDPNGATSISMVDYFGSVSYTVGSFNTSIEIPQSLSATDYEYRGKVFDGLAYTPTGAKISTQQINVIDVLNEPTAQISSSNVITLYAVWKDAAASITRGGTERFYGTFDEAWNAANGQTATVKLYKNVSVSSSMSVSSNITLDLNGHTMDSATLTDGSVFKVTGSGVTFTLNDSASGGSIYSSTGMKTCTVAVKGGGVNIGENATFVMNGGNISLQVQGPSGASSCGGGVYVDKNASFTMNRGSITNCKVTGGSSSYGGGVYVVGGTFEMTGGSITGNDAYSGGGVFTTSNYQNDYPATFKMTGGEISGNKIQGNATGGTSEGRNLLIKGTVTQGGNSFIGGTVTITESLLTDGGYRICSGNTYNGTSLTSDKDL